MPNSYPHSPPNPALSPALPPLTVWLLCDDKAGTLNQARGVAERLGERLERPLVVQEHRARARFPFTVLPARFWGFGGRQRTLAALIPPLLPPWPDLVIAAGRSAVAPAAAIRSLTQGRTRVVALQNPRLPLNRFDLVIAPFHDKLTGATLLELEGAPHRVSAARLAGVEGHPPPALAALKADAQAAGHPIIAVLLGGNSARYRFDPATAARLVRHLIPLAEAGARLALTPSRRTPADVVAQVKAALEPYPHFFWDGTGANPYLPLLAVADHILVTADSVSMLSEAASTGKPVYRIDLPGKPGKFASFHQRLDALGLTRPFTGTLVDRQPPPFDETGRAAAAVAALLAGPA